MLGIDTATAATAVALRVSPQEVYEERDDPAPGARPGHATRLLAMARGLLRANGIEWEQIERVAAGVGPGRFTGLRVGLASARGIAHSLQCELAAVSSLDALAAGALAGGECAGAGVLAVIDARRGEVFAAAYAPGRTGELLPPRRLAGPAVLAPEALGGLLEEAGAGEWLAVGDGALAYATAVERAGAPPAPPASGAHLVRAAAVAELGAAMLPADARETVLPEYLRRPDAELVLKAARRQGAPRA